MKFAIAAALIALSGAAWADDAWTDIRGMLYEDRPMAEAGALITTGLPARTPDDLRTSVAASIRAPEGEMLRRVTLVIDNNPMPVSAVFDLARPQAAFSFETTMRINGRTPVHVIGETVSGALFVAEHDLKTSGTGACAAPPGTDPERALAELGQMALSVGPLPDGARLRGALSGAPQEQLGIALKHPSHSGLQKDQITLLYIPFRYVETLDVALDGAPYLRMSGSISLSENPQIDLSIPAGSRLVEVTMTDTDGAVTSAEQVLPGS